MKTQGNPARAARPRDRWWETHFDNGVERIAWELSSEAVNNSRQIQEKLRELDAAIKRLEDAGADRKDTGILSDGITDVYLKVLDLASDVTLGVARRFDWEALWKGVTETVCGSWDWAEPRPAPEAGGAGT